MDASISLVNAMSKNPHAVALGRKGGKAKGKPKGFAAIPAAEAKRIRALATAARQKKEKPYGI